MLSYVTLDSNFCNTSNNIYSLKTGIISITTDMSCNSVFLIINNFAKFKLYKTKKIGFVLYTNKLLKKQHQR